MNNPHNLPSRACANAAWPMPACVMLLLTMTLMQAPATLQAANGAATPRHPVALRMRVTLDTVGAPDGVSPARQVGEVDQLRLIYDADAVDPVTQRVPLLNLQHLTPTGYDPPRPDPARMPMNDAWLDLKARPYRLHFRAAVTHGAPILIDFDEHTRRLTIRAHGTSQEVRIAGPYVIDPSPIRDGATAAAAPH